MSTPSSGPSDCEPFTRSTLVAAWLRALVPTGPAALPRPDLEELIATHVNAMAEGLAARPLSAMPAHRAGAALVRASFTDAECLRVSLRVLAVGLLHLATADGLPDPADRASVMLGGLGAGYAAELQDWLLDRQEEIKQALHQATDETERRLARSEAWFREVFVRAAVGIAISDAEGRLALVNPALADILGGQPDELVGRSIEEFFHPQETADLRADYHDLGGVDSKPLRRRRRLVRMDGQPVWAYLAVSVLRGTDSAEDVSTLHLTMVENVSDLHLLQDLTSYQSLHDVLTGLPTRQYLLSQLQSQLAGPSAMGHVTLYHLDLDGFGAINRGLGPEHGDRLMLLAARRLENQFVGQRVLRARLSGDEFALLVAAGSDPAGVLTTVAQINETLAEPVHLPDGGVGLSASIGVAHGVAGEIEPFELLRRAEVSLRWAQATGNRQWAEYDRHRDALERRDATLAATLSGALEFGQLRTLWEPWYLLTHDLVVGVSSRAVWDHPEYDRIDHYECLRLADMTGAAVPFAAWLIDSAADQIRAWSQRLGEDAPIVGINLTTSQIVDPDLVATVGGALETTGIRPDLLCVGVPAAALAVEDGEARESIAMLSSMGVRITLCDTGVTPVELTLLDDWPITSVEMALALVRRLARLDDPECRLARTTAALVGTLRDTQVPVVVPGLRTEREVAWWRSIGAVSGSGPYFSQPVAADELTPRSQRW